MIDGLGPNPDRYVLPDRLVSDAIGYVADTLGQTTSELLAYMRSHATHHVHGSQWVPSSKNSKTGSGPAQFIGTTRANSRLSCAGCRLLDGYTDPETGTRSVCYAHGGTPAIAHGSILRAYAKDPDRYSPLRAFNNAPRSAKFARFGSIGDPARVYRPHLYGALYLANVLGLDTLAYTHLWRYPWAQDLKPWALASCDTWEDVDRARSLGWRCTIVQSRPLEDWNQGSYVGPRKIGSGVVCPAMVAARVTCADCRLCDGRRSGPTIVFPEHGPGSNSRKRSRRKLDRVSYA